MNKPEIIDGYGKYVNHDGILSEEAQTLADKIASTNLRETLEKTKDKDGKQILSRHTISLLRRDYEFASRIEVMSKLAQRDADTEPDREHCREISDRIIVRFKDLVKKKKAENPFCDGSRPTNEKGVGGRTWDEACDTILKAIEEGK